MFIDMSSRFEVTNFRLTAVRQNLSKFWGFPRQFLLEVGLKL